MTVKIITYVQKSLEKAGVDKKSALKVTFPESITFEENDEKKTIILRLSEEAVGTNMQGDKAAFEGWALLLYTHYIKEKDDYAQFKDEYRIILDLEINAYDFIKNAYDQSCRPYTPNEYVNFRLHYNRFLYRALRFSQQYKWFSLSNRLAELVQSFDNYLSEKKEFTNNVPNKEKDSKPFPKDTNKIREENVEDVFADPNRQNIKGETFFNKYGNVLYRQLPVCLFEGNRAIADKAVFTGKKSAIDLWSCDKTELNMFELKYDNKMIGIITEVFFYANYLRDMFSEAKKTNFNCQKLSESKKRHSYRGYEHLEETAFTKINGFMLYDEDNLHQAITDDVIKTMNSADFDNNKCTITYDKIKYKIADYTVTVLEN